MSGTHKYPTKKLTFYAGHCAFWLIPILLFELTMEEKDLGIFFTGQFTFFYPFYYGITMCILYFYFTVFWLMPYLMGKYHLFISFTGAFVLYVFHSAFESLVDIAVARSNPLVSEATEFIHALSSNLIINILGFLLAIGYFFFVNLIFAEKNKVKLREEKLQLELAFLKSQINPHFLFNVLNNLYGTARKNSDLVTAEGIAELAGLMRYMLFESSEKKVLVE